MLRTCKKLSSSIYCVVVVVQSTYLQIYFLWKHLDIFWYFGLGTWWRFDESETWFTLFFLSFCTFCSFAKRFQTQNIYGQMFFLGKTFSKRFPATLFCISQFWACSSKTKKIRSKEMQANHFFGQHICKTIFLFQ